ncbi:pantoate--beta-alanine ligase [Demequina sp.]|uniref:pantoate--beta-alanine ligase n=1 Tax=Demequina sp. TaxID=2050685 RepID=UPI003D0D2D47
MRLVTTVADLGAPVPGVRRGVVMTMGALHEGHEALVRAARAECDEVVVTIFVNPLQFNDAADLERYPRTLDADLALLEPLGVDVVFAPAGDEVYPAGEPEVTVASGRLGEILEGAHRPGHFDGMLTVVLKLLLITRADAAYFGEKDAQQLVLVKRMVADFNVPVEIVGVPTVRAADGLALSSRNRFLAGEERDAALVLPRALEAVAALLREGRPVEEAVATGRAVLASEPRVVVDYLDVLESGPDGVTIAAAVRVGETRLIDNIRT